MRCIAQSSIESAVPLWVGQELRPAEVRGAAPMLTWPASPPGTLSKLLVPQICLKPCQLAREKGLPQAGVEGCKPVRAMPKARV